MDYSALVPGLRLQAESGGVFYAAEVMAVSAALRRAKAPVKVHFVGQGSEWDAWRGARRLRSKALRRDVSAGGGTKLLDTGKEDQEDQVGARVEHHTKTHRSFVVPTSLADFCRKSTQFLDTHKTASGGLMSKRRSEGVPVANVAPFCHRLAVVRAADSSAPVNLELWALYRDWVDDNIATKVGLPIHFHRFACNRLLMCDEQGLLGRKTFADAWQPHSQPSGASLTGGHVGNIVATVAESGLLGKGLPDKIMERWLRESAELFDERFKLAKLRSFGELTSDEEGEWQGDYFFIQIADPQLGMLHFDETWVEEAAMLRLAVNHINRLKPRFVLVSGDLINAFPSGAKANPEAAELEIAAVKDILRDVDEDIPLVLQPGNHDIGDKPFPEDVQRYRSHFGDDYFSFWVGGVFYLSINSQYYVDCEHTPDLAKEQDEWIEEELAQVKGQAQHVVICSHVPPFVGAEDEDVGWANWPKEPRQRVLELASAAGAKLWLAGHFHGNSIALSRQGVQVVVSGACGSAITWKEGTQLQCATTPFPNFAKFVEPPGIVADANHVGLRIVRVTERKIDHRFFPLSSVPSTLEEAFMGDEGTSCVAASARNAKSDFMSHFLQGTKSRDTSFASRKSRTTTL